MRSEDPKPLSLWLLTAKNRAAPPFHFTGVAHLLVVAAKDEADARHIAAGDAGANGAAWSDAKATDCEPLDPVARGVIAREVGA